MKNKRLGTILSIVLVLTMIGSLIALAATTPPSWVGTESTNRMRQQFIKDEYEAIYSTLNDLTTWLAGVNGYWGKKGDTGTTAGTNFVGTTDAVDLVFKRNSTELFRLVSGGAKVTGVLDVTTDIKNSDSSESVVVNDTFNVVGNQGWGSATPNTLSLVNAARAFAPASGPVNGLYLAVTTAPSASGTYANGSYTSVSKTNNEDMALLFASETRADVADTFTGTVTSAVGLYSIADCEDATCTSAYGIYSVAPALDTGTTTDNYGVYIAEGAKGSGTIANQYGLYVQDMTLGVTNNLSIYSGGAVEVVGSVKVGVTTPDITLTAGDQFIAGTLEVDDVAYLDGGFSVAADGYMEENQLYLDLGHTASIDASAGNLDISVPATGTVDIENGGLTVAGDVTVNGVKLVTASTGDLTLKAGASIYPTTAVTNTSAVFSCYGTLAYTNTTAKGICVLPANANVIDWASIVTTAFDDSGTDKVACGTDFADPDEFLDDLDGEAVGLLRAGSGATLPYTGIGDIGAASKTVWCKFTGQNSNAAHGALTFILYYHVD